MLSLGFRIFSPLKIVPYSLQGKYFMATFNKHVMLGQDISSIGFGLKIAQSFRQCMNKERGGAIYLLT